MGVLMTSEHSSVATQNYMMTVGGVLSVMLWAV
jgi:hypothetical protein